MIKYHMDYLHRQGTGELNKKKNNEGRVKNKDVKGHRNPHKQLTFTIKWEGYNYIQGNMGKGKHSCTHNIR